MADIQMLAKHIAETKKAEDAMVIVVGAMGETACGLTVLADEAGRGVQKSELDVLFSAAAQQTAALLAVSLQNEGLAAQSVIGFVQDTGTDKYGKSVQLKKINTAGVDKILDEGKIAVAAGFHEADYYSSGDVLAGGGADVTAVGIAAHLDCECEIYTNADCMYTVDTELYPQAKPIKFITHEEMMEVVNLGSNIIETKAVELAKQCGVKVFLGKSMESDKSKGTYIVSNEMIINENLMVEEAPITGVGIQDDVSIFTLRNVPADGKAVAECFRILGDLNINVDMISQQMAQDGTCTVSFSCSDKEGEVLAAELSAKEEFKAITVECESGLAMISLVGVGMATHSGVASQVFRVLAENGIRYYHITTSEISISVTVKMLNKSNAAIALCRAFDL